MEDIDRLTGRWHRFQEEVLCVRQRGAFMDDVFREKRRR